MTEWLLANPFWHALFRVLIFVGTVLTLVPGMIWWERRFLGWMQDRLGPNRVGNITFSARDARVPSFLRGKKIHLFGLLQPIADGAKLFFKEDVTPSAVDRAIYFLAPALALFPAFAIGATVPWGPFTMFTPVADVNIGVLYVLAISSLGVYGVVLAGYAGNNKYSLLGGLRASAQLISYELAMSMSVACMVLVTGSLRMTDMVRAQQGALWGFDQTPGFAWLSNWNAFTPYGCVAMIIFAVCMVAETNRAPFDLPEAENELIAGYHTEYSSMKFAVFFMGEYAMMFIFGLILTTMFFGGYYLLPFRFGHFAEIDYATRGLWRTLDYLNGNSWLGPVWMVLKGALIVSAYVWLRATLPRLRYDQLMSLGWKSLLPLATANLILIASWIVLNRVYGPLAAWVAVIGAAVILAGLYRAVNRAGQASAAPARRRITLVDPSAPRRAEPPEPIAS